MNTNVTEKNFPKTEIQTVDQPTPREYGYIQLSKDVPIASVVNDSNTRKGEVIAHYSTGVVILWSDAVQPQSYDWEHNKDYIAEIYVVSQNSLKIGLKGIDELVGQQSELEAKLRQVQEAIAAKVKKRRALLELFEDEESLEEIQKHFNVQGMKSAKEHLNMERKLKEAQADRDAIALQVEELRKECVRLGSENVRLIASISSEPNPNVAVLEERVRQLDADNASLAVLADEAQEFRDRLDEVIEERDRLQNRVAELEALTDSLDASLSEEMDFPGDEDLRHNLNQGINQGSGDPQTFLAIGDRVRILNRNFGEYQKECEIIGFQKNGWVVVNTPKGVYHFENLEKIEAIEVKESLDEAECEEQIMNVSSEAPSLGKVFEGQARPATDEDISKLQKGDFIKAKGENFCYKFRKQDGDVFIGTWEDKEFVIGRSELMICYVVDGKAIAKWISEKSESFQEYEYFTRAQIAELLQINRQSVNDAFAGKNNKIAQIIFESGFEEFSEEIPEGVDKRAIARKRKVCGESFFPQNFSRQKKDKKQGLREVCPYWQQGQIVQNEDGIIGTVNYVPEKFNGVIGVRFPDGKGGARVTNERVETLKIISEPEEELTETDNTSSLEGQSKAIAFIEGVTRSINGIDWVKIREACSCKASYLRDMQMAARTATQKKLIEKLPQLIADYMRCQDKKDFKWLPEQIAVEVKELLGKPKYFKGDFVIDVGDDEIKEVIEDDDGNYVRVRSKGGMPVYLSLSDVEPYQHQEKEAA